MSFQVRTGILAGILAIAAAGTPCGTIAQGPFEPIAKDAEQQRLVEQILETQSRDGPFSPALIDPLATLGELYQESGDTDLAVAASERARQVVRVNEGLFSLDQLPLLRRSIENAETIGDVEAAQQLEQDLKGLIRRHPDDLRTVPVLHALGDRQMDYLRRRLAGELPPPVNINISAGAGSFPSTDPGAVPPIVQAWRYYAQAINVLLHHQEYASPELDDLEMQIVRISYRSSAYRSGRASLLRQVSYDVARDEPWPTRIKTLIGVADWDLLFTLHGNALSMYEQAYALLKEKGASAEAIEEIFSPKVPIVLPTFLPNPLVTSEAGATGYIDVAFEIHRYGDGQHVRILGATANATGADKDELVRVIRSRDFRPRVTAGEFGRQSPVVLRYFLHPPLTASTDGSGP